MSRTKPQKEPKLLLSHAMPEFGYIINTYTNYYHKKEQIALFESLVRICALSQATSLQHQSGLLYRFQEEVTASFDPTKRQKLSLERFGVEMDEQTLKEFLIQFFFLDMSGLASACILIDRVAFYDNLHEYCKFLKPTDIVARINEFREIVLIAEFIATTPAKTTTKITVKPFENFCVNPQKIALFMNGKPLLGQAGGFSMSLAFFRLASQLIFDDAIVFSINEQGYLQSDFSHKWRDEPLLSHLINQMLIGIFMELDNEIKQDVIGGFAKERFYETHPF